MNVGLLLGGAAILGIAGIAYASKKKESSGITPKKCSLPTDVMIMQANNAILSKDPQLIQAVMTIFENYGCSAEAQAMRDWLNQNGFSPAIPVVITNVAMPMAGPGKVIVNPGERWRAAAVLGGIGCAVGLGTIRDKIADKGFKDVVVKADNPGWGKDWDAPSGFLECSRYVEATVIGSSRAMDKPKQIWRLERISANA